MCHINYYVVCIVFSLWTIVQTIPHLVFVVFSYFLNICAATPTKAPVIFYYITYLYKDSCPIPTLEPETKSVFSAEMLETPLAWLLDPLSKSNDTLTLDIVVSEILNNTQLLPKASRLAFRSSSYFLGYIILDSTWIISAVALLLGTCCNLKQTLALVFYGPWVGVTVLMSLLDVATCIHFGLDIADTTNFVNWAKFVGMQETAPFQDLDLRNSTIILSMTPTISICCLSSRFVLIWLSNLVGAYFVLVAASTAYRRSYRNEKSVKSTWPRSAHSRNPIANMMNTSAERIRSWQLFYGATDISISSRSSESERDPNSNRIRDLETPANSESQDFNTTPNIFTTKNGSYLAQPDVAGNIEHLAELRSQMPWSYIQGTVL